MTRLFSTRRRKVLAAAGVIVAIPALAIAWWLGSPLFLDRIVEEEFVFGGQTFKPASMSGSEIDDLMADAAGVDQPASEPMTGEMTSAAVVRTGAFRDADSFHRGSGKATLYRLADGSHVLRLEDFRVTNGPDLHVILSPAADPTSRAAVMGTGYVDLGSLKGNIGSQNYVLPDSGDPASFGSVVIYCKPFHVIFSVASLHAPG
jgi:hypothetical protein